MIGVFISALLLFLVSIIGYYNAQIIMHDKEKIVQEYKELSLSNKFTKLNTFLYFISHISPFNRFIDEFNKEDSTRKTKDLLIETNSGEYRVYRMKQVFLLFITLIIIAMAYFIKDTKYGLKLLFGNNFSQITVNTNMFLFFSILLIVISSLYPEIALKNKKGLIRKREMDDSPIIQNFIIVLIKSSTPIRDIIYEIASIENCYKETFYSAYKSFLRSEREGFEYLLNHTKGSLIEETVRTLSLSGEFSRISTIDSLIAIRQKTIEDILMKKRNKGSIQAVMGQISVLLPLIAMFLLGVYPFIQQYLTMAFDTMGGNL